MRFTYWVWSECVVQLTLLSMEQTDRQTDKVRYTYWVWSECVVQLTLLSTELTDRQTYKQTDRQGEVHLLGLVGVCCTADSAVDGTDRQIDIQTDRQTR